MKEYKIYSPTGEPLKTIKGDRLEYHSETKQTFVIFNNKTVAVIPSTYLVIELQ